jgi:predicted esterase
MDAKNSLRRLLVLSLIQLGTALLLLAGAAGCSRPDPGRPGTTAAGPPTTAAAEPAAAPLDYVELLTGDADERAPLPLVVAVHGLGDTPENFVDLYAEISAPARVVAPRAPEPYGQGSSWFPIEIPYRDDATIGAGIGAAADRVAALIAQLSERLPICGAPMITGFSQGGMVSFAVAVRHPDAIGFALPVAGALPSSLQPAGSAGRHPRIRALHGDADDMVPIGTARASVTRLEQLGFDVQLREYAGIGHRISPAMGGEINRLISLYARQAAATAGPAKGVER